MADALASGASGREVVQAEGLLRRARSLRPVFGRDSSQVFFVIPKFYCPDGPPSLVNQFRRAGEIGPPRLRESSFGGQADLTIRRRDFRSEQVSHRNLFRKSNL